MFCSKCGKEIPEGSAFCPACGASTTVAAAPVESGTLKAEILDDVSPKSRTAALILGIFLGSYGGHNFYVGRIGKAVTQLCLSLFGGFMWFIPYISLITSCVSYKSPSFESDLAASFGLLIFGAIILCVPSIWSFIEWIIIACGNYKDKDNKVIKNW